MMPSNQDIDEILKMRTVAIVGCSPRKERPANRVAAYLQQAGYRIIPVNPDHAEILGEKCYPSLLDIPEPVDVVEVFRRSEHVASIVQDAVRIKAKAVWMQDGVCDDSAAAFARAHGLRVVADDCLMRRHLSRFSG